MFLLWTLAAYAEDPEVVQAEYRRLHEESKKLAQKHRWEGVERLYDEMRALEVPLSYEDHMLGAQASRVEGDIAEMLLRLDAAAAIEPGSEADNLRVEVREDWLYVELTTEPLTPTLFDSKGLFIAADQRATIDYAKTQVEATGQYAGWLPPGRYRFAGQPFEITPEDEGTFSHTQDMGWGGKNLR